MTHPRTRATHARISVLDAIVSSTYFPVTGCCLRRNQNKLTTLDPRMCITNLVGLDLSENQLVELPDAIRHCSSLLSLELRHNKLQALPPELPPNLTYLNIRNNKVARLPNVLPASLEELWLERNGLVRLPAGFGHELPRLKVLMLGDNKLRSLPSTISFMVALEELDLRNNRLVSLTRGIGGLRQLKKLVLRDNLLTELPPEIGLLSNLESLFVCRNTAELKTEYGWLLQSGRAAVSHFAAVRRHMAWSWTLHHVCPPSVHLFVQCVLLTGNRLEEQKLGPTRGISLPPELWLLILQCLTIEFMDWTEPSLYSKAIAQMNGID